MIHLTLWRGIRGYVPGVIPFAHPVNGGTMHAAALPPARTLASLAPGDTGTIESFLFGAVRTLCGDLGIRQGQTVRCRAGTAGVLILDTQDGHTVSIARDWARFIGLGACPGGHGPPSLTRPAES
jgi:hypothetical protein